jgi:hypothetical protein
MADVVFLSSVFNDVKIAEPMGVCILTAALRERGISVDILEPSLDGWSVERTVEEVVKHPAPIVAISMLRDRHVDDVLQFVSLLRGHCPNRFIIIGGHGPSIAVSAIPIGTAPQQPFIPLQHKLASSRIQNVVALEPIQHGAIVDPALVDRGKGPGEVVMSEDADMMDESASPYFYSSQEQADSPYFDKSRDYLRILQHIDTYMLGEADTNFPVLVENVLLGQPWRNVAGLAFLDPQGRLVRTVPPAKISDLSQVPYMARDLLVKYQHRYGKTVPASLLASRGCYYRCTFCSVVQYEQLQAGSRHRQRPNDDLVNEMLHLYHNHGITHFNFEDDNFIVNNKGGIEKLHALCDRIMGLDFKPQFTFFCRADAVHEDLFRHFKAAGLSGIYFGMESVYPGDLEFFHKGTKVEDNFRALDTLLRLGFSLEVGSDARIMLGYITWHPLTTFDSLQATSSFVQRYKAPPKLLRRKLRLYSATEVVRQVEQLGLLNPDHEDGWNFQDRRIEGLDRFVNLFFGMVNKTRDKLRTLEKAHHEYGYMPDMLNEIHINREMFDQMLYEYFDTIVRTAAATNDGASSTEVKNYDIQMRARFEQVLHDHSINDLIKQGYMRCGFEDKAVDLFRK